MDWQREITAFQPQPPARPTTSLKELGRIEFKHGKNKVSWDQEGWEWCWTEIELGGRGIKLSLPKYLFNFSFFSETETVIKICFSW